MAALWIPKRLVELSLINTAGLSEKSFVMRCEHEYEARIEAAAKDIIFENKPIILITGPSASGKTTTANKIKESLMQKGKKAQVISLDNFYKNINEYPRLADGTKDYENITALELNVFKICLEKILKDDKAHFPVYDFKTETRHDEKTLIDLEGGFLIIEGIHALNPKLLDMLPRNKTFTIYAGLREEYSNMGQRILPTRDIRLLRRMIRDYNHRAHSYKKTIGMWPAVCAGEDKYIKVYKPNADLLLDTAFSYEILIIAKIVNALKEELVKEGDEKMLAILKVLELIEPLSLDYIPKNSMLMEFYG